jgi:hypothetical protein
MAIDAGGGLLGALAIGKAVGHGAPQVYKRRRKESETQAAEAARASVVYRPKLERVGGWQLLRQQNKMNADRLVEVLRRGIGAAMDKGMAYREFFHKLDADGSGEIEGRELRRGLRWLGIELGEREVNLILRRFSKDGRFLRYEDFLKFCEQLDAAARGSQRAAAMRIVRLNVQGVGNVGVSRGQAWRRSRGWSAPCARATTRRRWRRRSFWTPSRGAPPTTP